MSKLVQLIVTRKDLIDDTTSTIYNGNAELYDGRIIYNDTECEDGYTQVDYDNEILMILRKSNEHQMKLPFERNNDTKMQLSTLEGVIQMDVKTEKLIVEDDSILVIYSLLMDDKVVSRFEQLFKFRRDSDE